MTTATTWLSFSEQSTLSSTHTSTIAESILSPSMHLFHAIENDQPSDYQNEDLGTTVLFPSHTTRDNNYSSPIPLHISTTNSTHDLWTENDIFARHMIPVMVFVAFLMIVGIPGNTLVVYVYGFRFKSATQNVLIVYLACLDLVICVVAMPSEIVDLRFHHTFNSLVACKLLRFVTIHVSITACLTLISVAYDRHKRITQPLRPQMTPPRAKLVAALNLVCAACLSWPSPVMTGLRTSETKVPGLHGQDCSFSQEFTNTTYPLLFNCVLTMGFFTLIAILSILYFRIWKTAKCRKMSMAKRFTAASFSKPSSNGRKTEAVEEMPRVNIVSMENTTFTRQRLPLFGYNVEPSNNSLPENGSPFTNVSGVPSSASRQGESDTGYEVTRPIGPKRPSGNGYGSSRLCETQSTCTCSGCLEDNTSCSHLGYGKRKFVQPQFQESFINTFAAILGQNENDNSVDGRPNEASIGVPSLNECLGFANDNGPHTGDISTQAHTDLYMKKSNTFSGNTQICQGHTGNIIRDTRIDSHTSSAYLNKKMLEDDIKFSRATNVMMNKCESFNSGHHEIMDRGESFDSGHHEIMNNGECFGSDHPEIMNKCESFSSGHHEMMNNGISFSSGHHEIMNKGENFSSDHPEAVNKGESFSNYQKMINTSESLRRDHNELSLKSNDGLTNMLASDDNGKCVTASSSNYMELDVLSLATKMAGDPPPVTDEPSSVLAVQSRAENENSKNQLVRMCGTELTSKYWSSTHYELADCVHDHSVCACDEDDRKMIVDVCEESCMHLVAPLSKPIELPLGIESSACEYQTQKADSVYSLDKSLTGELQSTPTNYCTRDITNTHMNGMLSKGENNCCSRHSGHEKQRCQDYLHGKNRSGTSKEKASDNLQFKHAGGPRYLKRANEKETNKRAHIPSSTVDLDKGRSKSGRKRRSNVGRLDKTTVVALAVSCVFLVSFLPYLTVMAIRGLSKEHYYKLDWSSLCVYEIFVRFFLVNSAANPIIYGLFNPNFRRECCTTWRRLMGCCRQNFNNDNF